MDVVHLPMASLLFMAAAIVCLGSIALMMVRGRFSVRLMFLALTAGCVAAALMDRATGWTR